MLYVLVALFLFAAVATAFTRDDSEANCLWWAAGAILFLVIGVLLALGVVGGS